MQAHPKYFYSEVILQGLKNETNYWQIIRKVLQSFGCLSGQPAIFIAIESSINRHGNFSMLPRTRFITNEFSIYGFQKP